MFLLDLDCPLETRPGARRWLPLVERAGDAADLAEVVDQATALAALPRDDVRRLRVDAARAFRRRNR
jgi:hypothetical protein